MKAQHPQKKKPSEIKRNPLKELQLSAEDWEEFERGIILFNEGKFWHAHEAWEQVWRRHSEDERLFFQGLIQLAAAYHQLVSKGSFRGMLNNFDKALAKLEVFQPQYLGVLVTPLLGFIEQGEKEAARILGNGVKEFDLRLIPKLQFHKPVNPDIEIEINTILTSPEFLEGVRLFNTGYYWEAHEAWEDVWREQQGDVKTFAQGFVQMAAGYSFIKLRKISSAVYLFDKAIEKFQQFENVKCGIIFSTLIDSMRQTKALLENYSENGQRTLRLPAAPTLHLSSATK